MCESDLSTITFHIQKPDMRLGDLVVIPFEGGENIAPNLWGFAPQSKEDIRSEEIRGSVSQLGKATGKGSPIRRFGPSSRCWCGRPSECECGGSASLRHFKKEAPATARWLIQCGTALFLKRLSSQTAKATNLDVKNQNNLTAMRCYQLLPKSPEMIEGQALAGFFARAGIDAG